MMIERDLRNEVEEEVEVFFIPSLTSSKSSAISQTPSPELESNQKFEHEWSPDF